MTTATTATLTATVTMAADDFRPLAASDVTGFVAAVAVLAALAAILLIVAGVLSAPKRRAVPVAGAHKTGSSKNEWLRLIDDVRRRYHAGKITDDEAFDELAAVARRFASVRLGRDVTNHTLAELSRMPRSGNTAKGIDLLRQTIAALYPPQFADALTNVRVREASVDTAAGWVANLVERWRA
ncbi:hypothetical protein [Bifidobacterium simiarum]|uniref:hypothetical protein n=1 Tax=Bifidobacterium simiarum TaxID=2045441 RepID=UPI001BDCE944|nr:hypothetical protein [Bifidobacterium simiarum]MBT1165862.1 hypothetical protein [Bifidobacterium simiarum]